MILRRKLSTSGPEASAQVDVVVLKGGFDDYGKDSWTAQDFNNNIVREREGINRGLPNKSLVAEDGHLKLNKGIGVVHKLRLKRISSHTKNTDFRVGANANDTFDGNQIKEAKTESFIVKDQRSLRNEKRDPPCLFDFVWRLVNIGKRSENWINLQKQNVNTVKDFLILLLRDPQQLNKILHLRPRALENTVNHARRCVPDNSALFYTDSQQNAGVVFDIFGDLRGLVLAWEFAPMGNMSENDKANAQKLLTSARKHWEKVVHFNDMKSLQQHLSQSFTSGNPLDCPRLEGSSRDGVDTSEMFEELQSNAEVPISGVGGVTGANILCSRYHVSIDVPDNFFLSPGGYQDHKTFMA